MWETTKVMKHYEKLKSKAKASKMQEEETRGELYEKASVLVPLLGLMFWTRDQTHYWHLQTRSEATHKTLNAYYDQIVDDLDRLSEVIMGKYGRPSGTIKMRHIEDLVENSQILDHLCLVYDEIGKFYGEFNECESVKNILAEIQECINKTKYLLTLV
jgi:hypothetical protein